MDVVVSILDQEHQDLVNQIWQELEDKFGLRGAYAARVPHFSYHVARQYNFSLLQPALTQIAAAHTIFHVHTAGLGIFTGPQPVLYIPIVRTAALTALHTELWQAMAGATTAPVALYDPAHWVPHITLAHGDIRDDILSDLVRYLRERDFDWQLEIAGLFAIARAGEPGEYQVRFAFQAAP